MQVRTLIVPEVWKKRLYIKCDMSYWNSRKGNLIKVNEGRTKIADDVCLPEIVSKEDNIKTNH